MKATEVVKFVEEEDYTKATTDMLSGWLQSLGFDTLAADVKTETDITKIRWYARVVINSVPQDKKADIMRKFQVLKLA